jgi:hypothetical protein
MVDNILKYVNQQPTDGDKAAAMRDFMLAGYITEDIYDSYMSGLLSQSTDPSFYEQSLIIPECFKDEDGSLKFCLDLDVVESHEPCGLLKYKGLVKKNMWHVKTTPDNTLARRMTNHPEFYRVQFLEEYGFVRFGDYMVSRTVNAVAVESGGVMKDVALVLPYLQTKELVNTFPCFPSLAGGLAVIAVCALKMPSEVLAKENECPATGVLVAVGAPTFHNQDYPWNELRFKPQFYDEIIWEN